MKKISLRDDTYWKLLHLKVRMKCRIWKELVDRLHEDMGTKRLWEWVKKMMKTVQLLGTISG